MKVFMLQKRGFRAIACANKAHFCWVEFYPNSPHFSADEADINFIDTWLQGWEKSENGFDIPSPQGFLPWKQEIEDRVRYLPERWQLLSQAFFFAGLSSNEAVGVLLEAQP